MDFKDRVKEVVDIAQVIGETVRLKPMGPNRSIGLCPFHQEKTPSFHVHRDKQYFYCFGCHKGGDVFKFLMEIEGIGFYDALISLAERYGIPIPQRSTFGDNESRERDALLAMQEIALRHFRSALNSEAQEYLVLRNVSPEAIEEYALGYAPQGTTLVRRLQQEGFSQPQILSSGLAIQRDDGSIYDRFRHRLIFPIHNEQGKPIAFGGRAFGEDQPKYLNSSETKLYIKKRVLYNLHRAKETIRKLDHSILVEGYMDVIGLAQAGVRNVVASCGTALSEDHVRILKRHSDRIVVNFDPDNAGANAAERSIQMLLEESMRIRVLSLNDDLDPDEYVTRHGVDAYRRKAEGAESYFHWLADRTRVKFDMHSVEGRMEGFRTLLKPALERIPDKLERLAIVNDLSIYLGVDAKAVLDQLKTTARGMPTRAPQLPSLTLSESTLIKGLLANPAALAEVASRLGSITSWQNLNGNKILGAILGGALNYDDLDARLQETDRRLLASVIFADKTDTEVSAQELYACVEQMEFEEKAKSVASLRDEIRRLEREGRFEEALAKQRELPVAPRGRQAVR